MLTLLIHSPLLAILLGPLVTWLGNRGQEMVASYDRLPAVGKQAIAMLLSLALVQVSQLLSVDPPSACTTLPPTWTGADCLAGLASADYLTAVLTGLIAIAVKHGSQRKPK